MTEVNEKKPLFSIILPTKGRPELTRLGVESVLKQNFTNYELIVVDNDDGQETLCALNDLLDHPNLRYIRTGDLAMVENWNTALEHFHGEYLLWMDSKSFFYPNAFLDLEKFINHEMHPDVVSWKYDFIHDKKGAKFVRIKSNNSNIRKSQDVLEDFLNYRLDRTVWAQLPRGVCTAISQGVFTKIKATFTGDIFSTVSPDVILLLKILSVIDRVYYFPTSLTCVASTKVSHGSNLAARKVDLTYLLGAGATTIEEDMIVPLHNRKIVANLVANDIEKILNREIPIWQTHRTGYINSLAREIGSTIGRVGNVYERKELIEIIKFWGFNLVPYVIVLKRYLRCYFVTHFDRLPLNFRQRLLKLKVLKSQEIDVQDLVEFEINSFEVAQGLLENGRDWKE